MKKEKKIYLIIKKVEVHKNNIIGGCDGKLSLYTVDEIKNKIIPIAQKYGVKSISLFGLYARGEATEDSDVDILIDRGDIYSLLEYSGFINSLEDVLECNVDVVTTGSNNKDFLENISKDVVLIYEK